MGGRGCGQGGGSRLRVAVPATGSWATVTATATVDGTPREATDWCPVPPGDVALRVDVELTLPDVAFRGGVAATVPVPPGASVTVGLPLLDAIARRADGVPP